MVVLSSLWVPVDGRRARTAQLTRGAAGDRGQTWGIALVCVRRLSALSCGILLLHARSIHLRGQLCGGFARRSAVLSSLCRSKQGGRSSPGLVSWAFNLNRGVFQ